MPTAKSKDFSPGEETGEPGVPKAVRLESAGKVFVRLVEYGLLYLKPCVSAMGMSL